MRARDRARGRELDAALVAFNRQSHPLPGINNSARREALVEQLIESIRRVTYIEVIQNHGISELRADGASDIFDPLRAAALRREQGELDDAFWLVFLSVHFGKHRRAGWRLAGDVYGCLGVRRPWNWERISSDVAGFGRWIGAHQEDLKRDGVVYFGNHRKYETLKPESYRGTASVFESYVNWIHPPRTHIELVQAGVDEVGNDPRDLFDYLYRSMNVLSFGRTAKFDYLTMLGKLGLARIEPGTPYLHGSTGPVKGARLLFGPNQGAPVREEVLDARLVELGNHLHVGMQVIEDALCNWQKHPNRFVPFRG